MPFAGETEIISQGQRWQGKNLTRQPWFHPLLLLVWLALGIALRFTNLTLKPLWVDEFSTIVFGLGNSYRTIPLDQAINSITLLQPLRPDPGAGIDRVIHHLLSESNHPPIYFILTHLWLRLFPPEDGLVSIWAARSLGALLGAASIPAVFGLGWLAFRSQRVGQMAAAMMAVSPYGIFLAQEARHYPLAILWVIASLCCFVVATRALNHRTPLPIWVGLTWIGVNSLGIATHYFFALTLCAEGLALLIQGIQQSRREKGAWLHPCWRRIYAVAVGTLAGGLVWLPVWQPIYGSELTQWIYSSDRTRWEWLEPLPRFLFDWITMFSLLPVDAAALPIVIASALGMLVFLLWALPMVRRGLKVWRDGLKATPETRLAINVLGGFVLAVWALFFCFTYALDVDLTRSPRYHFIYFPGMVVLLGASLVACWNPSISTARTKWVAVERQASAPPAKMGGKKAVVLIWLMGLVSGLTVVGNLGYQRYERPALLVNRIQAASQVPVLIAMTHRTHGQTGSLMGIALEFKHRDRADHSASLPQFLLADQGSDTSTATRTLQQTLAEMPRPLDLWLVKFKAPVELADQKCIADSQAPDPAWMTGYDYQLYHCSHW